MNAYSKDLRVKVVDAVEQGGIPRRELVKIFGVSLPTIEHYIRQSREMELRGLFRLDREGIDQDHRADVLLQLL
jgi:transposase